MSRPSLLMSAMVVLRKDLLIEWRTKARLNALVFFAFSTLLMFSFALGPDTKLLQKNAGGYFWLAILFASVLALGESFRVESENNCLDGLRLAPTDARAVFLGKALGNTLLLVALSLLLIPVMVALYDVSVLAPEAPPRPVVVAVLQAGVEADAPLTLEQETKLSPGRQALEALESAPPEPARRHSMGLGYLALVILLGSLAISAPGTIYSAIANNARARDVLLPLLLFPLLVPALLSAVKATSLVLEGDPMGQLGGWLGLLGGFNLIYWGLGFALFPRVVED